MTEQDIQVVVVSGHPEDSTMITRALASLTAPRYVVETATTGEEGLRICLETDPAAPACVIVASSLIEMSGLEFLERSKGPAGNVPFPVVMFFSSGRDRSADLEAIRAGAHECIDRSTIAGNGLGDTVHRAIERYAVAARRRHSPDGTSEGAVAEPTRERFDLACEAVNGMLYEWDPNTRHVERSGGLFAITGFHPQEATPSDRWWSERVHPDDRTESERRFREVVARRGLLHEHEYRVYHRDGSLRHVWDRARIVYDDEGRIARVIGYTLDITDRVKTEVALRESEQRFRKLAMSDCIGIMVGDPHGQLSYVNDEYLRLLGYTRQEFEARPFLWTEITPPEWLEVDRRRIDEVCAGASSTPYEKEYLRKDGRRIPVLVGFALLSDDDDEVVAFVLDLTERKRVEKALKDADRRKNEFIAMLAHELRNPLAAINTAVHILRMKGPDVPELAWGREVIGRQVKQLTRLIEDLLDVSRIATGKIKLKRSLVDLREVVARAIDAVQPLIASREHRLEVYQWPDPLTADADPARLEQVVTNLLSNAAKFTECGGKISISSAREGRAIVLRVRDNGVGIAPEVRPYIFNLFAQAEAGSDRSQGGLGIGLTLVKSLVQMHGGMVDVASDGVGQGSEFVVSLPCVESDVADTPFEPHPDRAETIKVQPSHRSRVLVVDDNQDVVQGLAKLIETAGHDVRIAHDALNALRIAREFRPEYVLTDIGLPGMDGYELARAFRLDDALRRSTLIAISGYGQTSDRSRSRTAGFDHHLLKPVEPSNLLPLLLSSDHQRERAST